MWFRIDQCAGARTLKSLVSLWQKILFAKCNVGTKSLFYCCLQNVSLAKCIIVKMSGWQKVLLAKCLVGKMSVGKWCVGVIYVGKMLWTDITWQRAGHKFLS